MQNAEFWNQIGNLPTMLRIALQAGRQSAIKNIGVG
jgi:hypothetical protein